MGVMMNQQTEREATYADFPCLECDAPVGSECVTGCTGEQRAEAAEWAGKSITVRELANRLPGHAARFLRYTNDAMPYWQQSWLQLGWGDIVSVTAQPWGAAGRIEWSYPGEPTHLELPECAWGDYVGGTCERSNWRVLKDTPWAMEVYSSHDGHSLVMPLEIRIPLSFADQMVKLASEYPIIDDDDHSTLEGELADEMWDSFAYADLRRQVEDDTPEAGEKFGDVPEHVMRAWFYEFISKRPEPYHCEDAVSASFPDFDVVAHDIALRLMSGEEVPAESTPEV